MPLSAEDVFKIEKMVKGGCNRTPAMRAGAVQAAAPAGGTGATAGAYDTAANRNALIALVNEMRLTLIQAGLMKGSA